MDEVRPNNDSSTAAGDAPAMTYPSTNKPRWPTPARVRDYVLAVREAGFEPDKVEVEPDGTLRMAVSPEPREETPLDRWIASREAR